ncbi:TPA: peptidylprolyl isomerase [Candidatus Woesearchaeota archaeon]|nr:peptidylprolyl isomerase [Candidatus Woesearchaeota archaeon]
MIQHGDFVKLNYTGKLSDGTVFDTTDAAVAKHEGLEGTKSLSPVTICVGQHMLVAGLDAALIGKGPGRFSVALTPDTAFGRKDARLIKIIPLAQLHAQKINPHPGLRLNIDGNYGVVRSVSSGRTVVDFNHPLASQDVVYDVEVISIVEDKKEQINALLSASGLPFTGVHLAGEHATVHFAQMLPKPLLDALQARIAELVAIKTVSFEAGIPPANKTAAHKAA